MIQVGLRVVRGPDWMWGDEDGGEGGVGTILAVGPDVSNDLRHYYVKVVWDTGHNGSYRTGYKGNFDLRIYDNAQIGVRHLTVTCDSCLFPGIVGMRFSCNECDYDLCFICYMKNKHNKNHYFTRFTTPESKGVLLEPRSKSLCVTAKGIFMGAVVLRGQNWNRGNEDNNGFGYVLATTYSEENAVCVSWDIGKMHEYRIQDLLCKKASSPGIYFPSHLPVAYSSCEETVNSIFSSEYEPIRVMKMLSDGSIEPISRYLQKNPQKVDEMVDGKSWLQEACYKGHFMIATLLMSLGASLSLTDSSGNTSLHFAAMGNHEVLMEKLLKADDGLINIANNEKQLPLHISISNLHLPGVQVLLKYNVEINAQDNDGSTPLHLAIELSDTDRDILNLISGVATVSFVELNKAGFNVLHLACLYGKHEMVEALVKHMKTFIELKKKDGLNALHIACLNGHRKVAEVLLSAGADVNSRTDGSRDTPLMLAAALGRASIVEMLVEKNATVTAQNSQGDTCLHMMVEKKFNDLEFDLKHAPNIYSMWKSLDSKTKSVGAAIACYLVMKKANISIKNKKGRTPLNMVEGTPLEEVLKKYSSSAFNSSSTTLNKCKMCNKKTELIKFEPCGHRVACKDCLTLFKKCIKCKCSITQNNDASSSSAKSKNNSQDNEIDQFTCGICWDNKKEVIFQCGHGACNACSVSLTSCHICRQSITTRIKFF